MKAVVDNDIKIVGCTNRMAARMKAMLTFKNPEYENKVRMGRWVGNTPKFVCLYERNGDTFTVPFGMLDTVFEFADEFDLIAPTAHIKRKGVCGLRKCFYGSCIKLYGYQEKAVQAVLEKKNGVLVAPCGAGKTQIGLEIAAKIGGRTLWLTHTTELLKQSMDRARALFTALKKDDFGTITSGKIDIGRAITFATVQTMRSIDLQKYKYDFDTIIVDECHHVCGTPTRVGMFYEVITSLSARYKIGLTATPKRSDGLIGTMYGILGKKIYEISRDDVAGTTCPVMVFKERTKYFPLAENIMNADGTLNYCGLISDLCNDNDRNKMIVNAIEGCVDFGERNLVLTDRLAHADKLQKMLKKIGIESLTLTGHVKTRKKSRDEVLRKIKDGEVLVVIATYSLAKEGLDIPQLNNIFFATPQKNETTVEQSAGRVARKAEGKECGYVYDFVDPCAMLKNWEKKRDAIYKRLGYDVEEFKEMRG